MRDTLAALGGGVAATLKAHGADSVIATTTVGANISGIAVAGIDSIVLVAGNYTLTAAQAALVDGTTGPQTLTLTTQASGTLLPASVENFVLGNFANSVTLGAAAQSVSGPAGTATTLAIAGTAPTGTWALANGADVLVATNGANIAGVNAGAATTAESLTLTGGITMTRAQHEALTGITAAGSADSVNITTGGSVTARSGVESYLLSSGGANSLNLNNGATGITGSAANATSVSIGNKAASGTWNLQHTADVVQVTTGASLSGVNGGAATTAEQLTITGSGTVSMTAAQHDALAITAAGTETVVITGGSDVTASAAIENYEVSQGGSVNLAVNAGKLDVGITGVINATTISIAGNSATGNWSLGTGADVIVASNGASIAGVNGGLDTTAETLDIAGTVSLTQAQHEALASVTGATGVARITSGGTVTGKDASTSVAGYNLSSIASNTFDVAANKPGVNLTGASANTTTVNLGGKTASGTWSLGAAGDVLRVTDGANFAAVNGGLATTAEVLVITDPGTVTMTAAQHSAFTFSAAGSGQTVQLASAGNLAAQSVIEGYAFFGAGASTIAVATSRTVDFSQANGAGASTKVQLVGATTTAGGTWALAGSADTLVVTSNANITNVNAGAATTAETLELTGGITMTRAQHDAFTAITATGISDSITIADSGAVTARAGVESYTVSSGGSNSITVLAGTSVNGNATNATTINVGSNSVAGIYNLAHTADVLEATDGAKISNAVITGIERLVLTGAITMTAGQYTNFSNITAAGSSDRITLTTALTGGQILNAAVESFTLAAANNTVTLGASQSIDAQALTAGQTLSLAGTFAAGVALANGNLSSSATGNLTVTGGTGANTITLGSGNDTVNAGDGNDLISGGAGVDTLNGEAGNDSFFYGAMADFLAAGLVIDRIHGGADTDAIIISGTITLDTSSDLRRMTTVEQLKAQAQSATQNTHSIALSSDTFLGGLTTIDLSGDTKNTSTSIFDLRGVTQGMTLKGVGVGYNEFTGGSGADTLIGGNGADMFFYHDAASFISGTGVVDSIDGGGAANANAIVVMDSFTVGSTQSLARITNVESLRSEAGFVDRTYALTIQSDANLGSISKIDLQYSQSVGSSAAIDLSGTTRAMTVIGVRNGANTITGGSGADTLSGGQANDTFRGGGGSDTITTSNTGTATYVFEATGSANGTDTLTGVRSNGRFDFSGFLGTAGVLHTAAVDSSVHSAGLDLTAGNNIGVRYGTSSLGAANILLATNASVAGEVAVADNGKAVVFSFSASSVSNSANGSIYYVQDTDPGAGQSWAVTLVGTMSGSSASISQIVSSAVFL